MQFADQPKSERYDQASGLTQKLLTALQTHARAEGHELSIQSTDGGGILDISGHDAVFVTPLNTYSVQVSVRPVYNSKYWDLLWERWEYPSDNAVPGRSQNYMFDWWYHFVKAEDDNEYVYYAIKRDKLRETVELVDRYGPISGLCTKKFVHAKPGDPAKELYCITPWKVATVSGRLYIE